MQSKLTPQEEDVILQLRRMGKTQAKIAPLFDISQSGISRAEKNAKMREMEAFIRESARPGIARAAYETARPQSQSVFEIGAADYEALPD